MKGEKWSTECLPHYTKKEKNYNWSKPFINTTWTKETHRTREKYI
jgi:hypothetical protein